jgi:hypothetical protein
LARKQDLVYLSTGHKVRIGKNRRKFVDRLAEAILRESATEYKDSSSVSVLIMIKEEIDYVVTRNFTKDPKVAEFFLKDLLSDMVIDRFCAYRKKLKKRKWI